MSTNITFRTQLLGGVTDFCNDCGLTLLSKPLHLVELIVSLARYKEEGVRLNPQVYISNDIPLLTSMLPNGEKVRIGVAEPNLQGIKKALKKTAPLATDGWSIYFQNTEILEYGVFRGSGNPLSVAMDDILLDRTGQLSVVKVFNVADECVEIRSSNGHFHHVFLDHRKEDTPPPLQYLDHLVASITASCNEEHREALASFLKKNLFTAMRESHGCIVAVTNKAKLPAFVAADAVILDPPIDFGDLVMQLKKAQIDSSILTNKGALLKGMLNSDGIVLFDNAGRLLGFNCFVRVKSEAGVVGGARRRAFDALSKKIGSGLAAAFMQSQDGWTEYKGSGDGK